MKEPFDLLVRGGTVVVAAPCPLGTGPIATVNRGIYEIGLRPRLPAEHRVVLVSDLSRDSVAPTYCTWAASAQGVVDEADAVPTVLPRAGSLVVRPVQ